MVAKSRLYRLQKIEKHIRLLMLQQNRCQIQRRLLLLFPEYCPWFFLELLVSCPLDCKKGPRPASQIYSRACIRKTTSMCICAFARVCSCTCVLVWVRACVWVCACVPVCVLVCVGLLICACMLAYLCACDCVLCACLLVCLCACVSYLTVVWMTLCRLPPCGSQLHPHQLDCHHQLRR